MNTPKFSIPIATGGMILFTVLCNSQVDVSSELLFGLLMALHVGLVWMVFTILKREKPVQRGYSHPIYNKAEIDKKSDPNLTVVG